MKFQVTGKKQERNVNTGCTVLCQFSIAGKFFATVDHRGTSKQCPDCGTGWDNNLSIRWHKCNECGYENNRDVAAAVVIRNRGTNKYPGTTGERKLPANSVLSGIFNLDKCYAGMPVCEDGKPAL